MWYVITVMWENGPFFFVFVKSSHWLYINNSSLPPKNYFILTIYSPNLHKASFRVVWVCSLSVYRHYFLSLSSCVCPSGNVSVFAGSEISTLTVSESLPRARARTHGHSSGWRQRKKRPVMSHTMEALEPQIAERNNDITEETIEH